MLTVNLISPMDFYWGMSASFKRILITPTYLMFVIVFFEIYSSKYKNIKVNIKYYGNKENIDRLLY